MWPRPNVQQTAEPDFHFDLEMGGGYAQTSSQTCHHPMLVRKPFREYCTDQAEILRAPW